MRLDEFMVCVYDCCFNVWFKFYWGFPHMSLPRVLYRTCYPRPTIGASYLLCALPSLEHYRKQCCNHHIGVPSSFSCQNREDCGPPVRTWSFLVWLQAQCVAALPSPMETTSSVCTTRTSFGVHLECLCVLKCSGIRIGMAVCRQLHRPSAWGTCCSPFSWPSLNLN